jgi:hypothetical protein
MAIAHRAQTSPLVRILHISHQHGDGTLLEGQGVKDQFQGFPRLCATGSLSIFVFSIVRQHRVKGSAEMGYNDSCSKCRERRCSTCKGAGKVWGMFGDCTACKGTGGAPCTQHR